MSNHFHLHKRCRFDKDQAEELQLRREQLRYVLTESQHQEDMAMVAVPWGVTGLKIPEGWAKIWKHIVKQYKMIMLSEVSLFPWRWILMPMTFRKNTHHSWDILGELKFGCPNRQGDPRSKGAGEGRGIAQYWLLWFFSQETQLVQGWRSLQA